MNPRHLVAAGSLIAGLVVTTACGSSSPPASPSPTPSASPTTVAGATTAPPASMGPASPTISGVVTVSNLPHEHFLGVHLTYSHTPPLGGDHSPYPLNCAVYTAPVPNENAVHSLEHGAVWLTYQPGVDPQSLADLAKRNPSYVLVSPYAGQPAKVMATAWGLQLSAQTTTDPRLKSFVEKYAGGGQGGEPGAACSGVTPQQGEQLLQQGPLSGQPKPPVPADKPS